MHKSERQVSAEEQSSPEPRDAGPPPGAGAAPPATGGTHDASYLNEIRKDDLDEEMREVVENAFSRQTILGYIKDARHHELTWLFRNNVDRIQAYFPPRESSIQGEYRAQLLDDPDNQKQTLRQDQLEHLKQITWAYILDLSRSKEGQQQEWLSNVHRIDEKHVSREDNSGGLTSVFD